MAKVFPVIHFLDAATALSEADLAFECGADGVFLISHQGDDDLLFEPAAVIKRRHPGKLVGLNLLTLGAAKCVAVAADLGLDAAWADHAGVNSAGVSETGMQLAQMLKDNPQVALFAGVAFKGQQHEPEAGAAAKVAQSLGMVPTTSGARTGHPPEVRKIEAIRAAIGAGNPLAIASGLSPENVADFARDATHFLVSTHVSRDEYHLDRARLEAFISKAKPE
ncbi:BtpA/SgcQ family protein [Burkholderia sp. Ac-20365]|uniref:BtpA/SgcQ family protein n=1 Tax=Burkholderia sp. Ac-20365 TaxID=2703897 RepID=UPI00197C9E97|nr:BtpA/SgcQ family protein [Burkholderia sp. Ac-20365]MBN3761368.1 hypothetical protein [Burkholderia sp. Ac-20365]